MKIYLCILLFAFTFLGLDAQTSYRGVVKDSITKAPLAFVNIVINESFLGTTTDIDGKFEIRTNKELKTLKFSYLGYKLKGLKASEFKNGSTILMSPIAVKIKEVEILPGVNPAHRLINLAIENRNRNNPEKATEFFYESYNKLIFTGDLDSNILANQDSIQKLDTIDQNTYELFSKQHLFMMESITERSHIPPDNTKEVVVASRISGLKNPIFSLIGTQLQSFSLYNNYISLFGNDYLSPISKGSTSKYLFILSDTLIENNDTIYTIRFQPRKGKNFDALKGVIYLNTNGYAIQNLIAEPNEKDGFDIKIQQKYEFVDGKQWFPVQLNTNMIFEEIQLNNSNAKGIGRSYIKNIQLKSKLEKKEIGNTVLSLDPKAGKKTEDYWNEYRADSLDSKEQETYRIIDSIGDAENLDEKILLFRTFATGAIPLGPFDFPIKYLMDYNDYEGFRLGLGAETNDKFIKGLRIGGYGAYGFKDQAGKYGAYTKWTPKSNREIELKLSYSNDVKESGGTQFANYRVSTFSNEGLKKLYISRMDGVEKYEAQFGLRAFRDFKFNFFGNKQFRTINSDYTFSELSESNEIVEYSKFNLVETGVDIRYSYKEKFAEMFGMKFPVSTKYPVLHLRVTQGFDNLLDGDFEYQRIDLKIDQSILWKGIGVSSFRVAGGFIEGEIPLTAQFRTQGTFSNGLLLATEYSFETVRPNEFYSDRYFNFFFRHNFKNLLYKGVSFKPELSLIASYAIGELKQTNGQHQNVEYLTLDKGLWETGLAVNNLLNLGFSSFGVSAFYRLGEYSFEKWEDNFVAKLSTTVNF